MKKTILLFGVFLASFAFAQVSISPVSTDTPEATLDVKAMKSTTSPDGILIPRLTRAETLAMNGTIKEATMIYVTDNNTTAGTGTVVDVDTKGFYYFDAAATPAPGKWVKVGAAPAKTIRTVAAITVAEWANNQYALVQTTTAAIQLPPPASNNGRIISVNNQAGTTLNYSNPAPSNNSTIRAGRGQLLMSDGASWYVIGGF